MGLKPTRHPLKKNKKDGLKKRYFFPLSQLLELVATRGHGGRKYQQHIRGIRHTHVQQVHKRTQKQIGRDPPTSLIQ